MDVEFMRSFYFDIVITKISLVARLISNGDKQLNTGGSELSLFYSGSVTLSENSLKGDTIAK